MLEFCFSAMRAIAFVGACYKHLADETSELERVVIYTTIVMVVSSAGKR